MTYRFNVLDTPLGPVSTGVDPAGAVAWVAFGDACLERALPGVPSDAVLVRDPAETAALDGQLLEYFAGRRSSFDLPLAPRGSEFQKRVWAMLSSIPFGETRSYGQIARELGREKASRAVGRANATNPIAVIVPCHRVIGSSGSLTGYAGGLPIKQRLLEHERLGVLV
jgi:methylated-DNA-[protein]-cysteine S-methyltransferase